MATEAERQYQNEVPPFASTTPGEGVTILATSTTAADLDMSAHAGFYNRLLTITAGTSAVWVSFSDDGVTAIDKSSTGGATIAAGTVKANAIRLAAGASIRVRLDPTKHKHIHFQADADTPTLTIRPSSQKRLRQ